MVGLDQGGRLASTTVLRPVLRSLRAVAESSFVLSMDAEDSDTWLIVPDMSAHVLLHFDNEGGGSVLSRARVVGSRTHAAEVSVRRRSHTVGVRLSPGGLAALTGLPGGELVDRSVALGDLWGHRARSFLSSLPGSSPEVVRIALMQFLAAQAGDGARADWRIRGFASLVRGGLRDGVDRSAERLGLGRRTLRRVCQEAIGFGPKRFHRIQRLYRGISTAVLNPNQPGARLAAAAGYADQPHMIREFRALLGETPTRFLGRAGR